MIEPWPQDKDGPVVQFERLGGLLTNWFANGMSENDVMILAGHANFATTHKFYLAVADDLVDRARKASANGLVQNLAHIWHAPAQNKETIKADNCNQLSDNDL